MIDIQKLSVSYKKQQTLKDLTYNFKAGQIYGLLGPNGSGKTTLFKAILNLVPYSGSVTTLKKSTIGHLIEYPGFYANLTCQENLCLHASYINLFDLDFSHMFNKFNLSEEKEKKFKNLSLGMKQRLGLIRAMMNNPDIILLDEPTNGLDPIGIKDMREIITREIKSAERTAVISSHMLHELKAFADTLILIKDGVLIGHLFNSRAPYGLVSVNFIEKTDTEFKKQFQHPVNILKTDIDFKIYGNYEELSAFYSNCERHSLESLYVTVMNLNIQGMKLL
ncbi:ATP-binding cassette domain-containing protein [Jeotgalicoccus nanhaiensis]|uniref:ATP-binding cassette domain-containing protein n=1 Tax=Jeotgalicoccus nanhaiensis TaxID=568603 RepID=A0ABR9XYA9_9STAP|nr:ATP-binding cassette domain-containing protein [Jeotgalicoccus nanhaiensis]MBF0753776.1 ATP-binding cassette domain-containing protein [Jeotgalicoccus nanhaiensis]TFU61938.1 ATP-binding cassette domain-containing protein [Jeotgalicoccus nanhaiensis]